MATETADRARREFLRKAGQLAAYTPPVMLALMYPGAHAVASGGGGGNPTLPICQGPRPPAWQRLRRAHYDSNCR
jgi:hypothetical protein